MSLRIGVEISIRKIAHKKHEEFKSTEVCFTEMWNVITQLPGLIALLLSNLSLALYVNRGSVVYSSIILFSVIGRQKTFDQVKILKW